MNYIPSKTTGRYMAPLKLPSHLSKAILKSISKTDVDKNEPKLIDWAAAFMQQEDLNN